MIRLFDWDHFFDTKEKRDHWISAIVIIYTLWQCIWQINFFFHLSQVYEYADLFRFYRHLNQYTSSLLVRLIYAYVLKSHLSISLTDVVCLILTAKVLITKYRKVIALFFIYGLYMLIELYQCLHVTDVGTLIVNFHRIAWVSMIGNIIFILFVLYKGVTLLLKYMNHSNTNVHE